MNIWLKVLLGIVSFGENDCGRRGGKPGDKSSTSWNLFNQLAAALGVYTNVLDHVDWLQEKIGQRSKEPPTTVTPAQDLSNLF